MNTLRCLAALVALALVHVVQAASPGSSGVPTTQTENIVQPVGVTCWTARKRVGAENMVRACPDAAVTLYHNNAAKLATLSTGISVTGDVTATGGTFRGANAVGTDTSFTIFGGSTGAQLVAYGSTHATKPNDAEVLTDNYTVLSAAGTETLLRAVENSSVRLYYDNTLSIETEANGDATVYGRLGAGTYVQAPLFGRQGNNTVSTYAGGVSGGSSSGSVWQLYGASHATKPNDAEARADLVTFFNAAGTETQLTAAENGAVTLYYDNAAKLATSSAGGTLTGTWNATTGLQVNGVNVVAGGQRSFGFFWSTDGADCTNQWNPNSWSCVRDAVGQFTITHNFGDTDYACTGTSKDAGLGNVVNIIKSANSVHVDVYNAVTEARVEAGAQMICVR